MDPNLHQKQAINHLNRVLSYYPFVAEAARATVHLTVEDWNVVADALFHMDTPKEMVPDAIESYRLTQDNGIIELKTADCLIELDMI